MAKSVAEGLRNILQDKSITKAEDAWDRLIQVYPEFVSRKSAFRVAWSKMRGVGVTPHNRRIKAAERLIEVCEGDQQKALEALQFVVEESACFTSSEN